MVWRFFCPWFQFSKFLTTLDCLDWWHTAKYFSFKTSKFHYFTLVRVRINQDRNWSCLVGRHVSADWRWTIWTPLVTFCIVIIRLDWLLLHSTKYRQDILLSKVIPPLILDDSIRWRCAVNFNISQPISLIKTKTLHTFFMKIHLLHWNRYKYSL